LTSVPSIKLLRIRVHHVSYPAYLFGVDVHANDASFSEDNFRFRRFIVRVSKSSSFSLFLVPQKHFAHQVLFSMFLVQIKPWKYLELKEKIEH